MPTRCNKGFYCRSYCLLNMFRAPLCPSSGAQEYYTVVAACGIWCCGFLVVGLVWSWGLCVRFAGLINTIIKTLCRLSHNNGQVSYYPQSIISLRRINRIIFLQDTQCDVGAAGTERVCLI